MPQRDPGTSRPSTGCASRVIQPTFGRSLSWLDDQTAAENITSVNASSKRSRIASEALARLSQVCATSRYAALTVGCSISSSAASSCSCWETVATGSSVSALSWGMAYSLSKPLVVQRKPLVDLLVGQAIGRQVVRGPGNLAGPPGQPAPHRFRYVRRQRQPDGVVH